MSRRSRVPVAVLVAGALVVAPGTGQAAEQDYTITVDVNAHGADISDTMYGVFFEDINRAADGGLYAELVQNRSFEYDPADNAAYTPLTGWAPKAGNPQVVDDDGRLNERNRRYLRLPLPGGIINAGYNSGLGIEKGKRYDFSVWARTDQASTPLTVSLTDPAGTRLAAPLNLSVRGASWTRYTGTFTVQTASITGRLLVEGGGVGTLSMDMVSVFPRDTYKNRPNGMRRDLAEKIAALHPKFVRFPGGCLVNTGSHYGYEAPNWERRRSYQWKDTIGPVETRATNANFWGYNQSYGIGYYEYFQFAADLGAEPIPVVPVGVTGCGDP